MREFLILKLQGPLQAWGKETFEGLRPSELFPGRSVLLGLLGACLGVDRTDKAGLQALASSVAFAVRVDQKIDEYGHKINMQKMTDYHTVKNARVHYQGLKSHETIQTWREYWQDACYTVAIWSQEQAAISLSDIEKAIKQPVYTPFLGRRSCPITRPLFETKMQAETALMALAQNSEITMTIYSEEYSNNAREIRVRDVPIIHQPRQFASRKVFMTTTKGAANVS
ncbi:MAG: type I-E CRISPR-associated protein Cas5/CasD [Cycloclasticus sp.]|jgi:CRISPR system Cascade subunit CasD|nr:type I-E CRISPR-associated protein Cas5/CasD [Cycloclasticus sp.]